MGKLIKCKRCKTNKNVTAKYMRQRAEAYDGDVDKLKKSYICRSCRTEEARDQKQFSLNSAINELESFKNLSNKVRVETAQFLTTNITNPKNQAYYKNRLKSIFDEHDIKTYNINVENKTIKSLTFKIPIIGSMEIKI
jgi:hypothetical protein